MTPTPDNAPVKAAALPLVALILGVIGFCMPPLFPIAIILAIVSLVKGSEPAFASRKVLAIITLVLGVIYVPVVGILAAIAIPNFMKFQAKAKQSECKTQLKSAWFAQQSFFADKNRWGTTAEEIGFSVQGNRYAYWVGVDGKVPQNFKIQTSGQELEAGYSARLLQELKSPEGDALTMACAGNIDNDATIDVWSISSAQRTIEGQVVPPGTPFNEVDDFND